MIPAGVRNDAPSISVLMPVYNAKRYVRAAVESVLVQTFKDFELLVLDDGSTDNSLSILCEFEAQDSRVRVMSRANRGVVITRNELLTAARGRYLALLDSDDICRPHRFEMQIAYLDSHPECVAVGSRALLIDPDGMPIMETENELTHEEIDFIHLSGLNESRMCNSSVIMRREKVLQIGGYREEFRFAEDLDLYLRLSEIGRLANLSHVLVEYRHHLASLCYTESEQLHKDAKQAVNDALQRRGMDNVPVKSDALNQRETTSDVHRKWAWWALSAGNVATARKHAFAAAALNPLKVENLRVVACAVRGY